MPSVWDYLTFIYNQREKRSRSAPNLQPSNLTNPIDLSQPEIDGK